MIVKLYRKTDKQESYGVGRARYYSEVFFVVKGNTSNYIHTNVDTLEEVCEVIKYRYKLLSDPPEVCQSDVIAIIDEQGARYYVCEAFGFYRQVDFDPLLCGALMHRKLIQD